MKLSSKSWSDYITKLSQINKSAADQMRAWIEANGTGDADAMIKYAYALVTKYGEASSALACEMYDAMAELEKVSLPAAEPAPTATYKETAKAINGAALRGAGMIPGVVDRLTKQAGQDTTVHNAIRDGAEWAWIPKGDTCAFCITLASNGWQRASVDLLRGNHAEHIHANCDCAFAIRHGKDGDVAGYDPEQYLLAYKNAEGTTPRDKINAMRRAKYAQDKKRRANDEIELKTEPIKNVNIPAGYSISKHEEEISVANWINSTLGGEVELIPEANVVGKKTPDFMWNNKMWELKSITSEKAADSAIRSALKQISENPGGIILDYKEQNLDLEKIEKIINQRLKRSGSKLNKEIVVIIKKGSKVIKEIRYKK